MPYTDIGQTLSTDIENNTELYPIDSETTDATDAGEYRYQSDNWSKWFGYYKNVPELRAAIDCIATWTVGKGYTSDVYAQAKLLLIRGNGTDTFNTILENMIRTMYINGDSFAEIIVDDDGEVINIKPLDPRSIVIVAEKGVIKRYEQVNKTNKKKKIDFDPSEILHFSRNRVADEVHGTSMVEALEWMLEARNRGMRVMDVVVSRYAKPMRIWYVDTDDPTEIANFKTKIDDVHNKTENVIVPKGTVEHELVSVPQNATLSPVSWTDILRKEIFRVARVPEIIVGGSTELTEASAKIAYLAFQQTIEEEQLYVEEQVLHQLFMFINLEFPASLERDLLSDKRKDAGSMQFAPADVTAGRGQ